MATVETGQMDDAALIATLQAQMAASLLPNEGTLSDAQLADAAAFLMEAARQRPRHEAALLVRSGAEGHRATRIAIGKIDTSSTSDVA